MAGTTYAYSAYLNYSEEITADEITIILNGTTYTVSRQEDGQGAWYGSIELYDDGEAECQYPFCIYYESNRNKLLVSYDVYANHNPVSVEIIQESGVTTTPCFNKARGYSCDEEIVTLTEESVTTAETESGSGIYVGGLSYLQLINAETIKVTFNGTEYECPRIVTSYGNAYGGIGQSGPDFSEYPFAIISTGEVNEVYTETAGTYAIKIEMVYTVATTTSCFDKARGYSCSETTEVLDNETVTTTHNDKGNFNIGYLNNFYLDEAIQKLTITFDNVEYECTHNGDGTYGSTSNVEFPTYPFQIYMDGTIYTSTDGEHSVKIEYVKESITASECFQKAVQFASSPLRILMTALIDPAPSVVPPEGWSFDTSAVNVSISVPYNAIKAAYDAGRLCIVNFGSVDVLLAPFGSSFRAMHTWSNKYIASAQDGSKDVWLCQTSDLQIHDDGTSILTMTKAYYATTR